MELHQNNLYTFIHDAEKNTIRFVWTPQTESMSDLDFKDALSNFAGFAASYRTPNLVVDVRQFKYQMHEALGTWRDTQVTPRYNEAGVAKFAYIVPSGAAPPEQGDGSPAQGSPEKFKTQYFESESEADAWFKQ